MKTKKLLPENITKTFRKFSGDLCIQINDKQWISIPPSEDTDKFIRARNTGKLESVTLDENKKIVELKLKTSGSDRKQEILDKVKKVYRHG